MNKDITIKIEEPIGEDIDIKNDFGVGKQDDDDKKGEKNSDESDNQNAESHDLHYMVYTEPIKAIFTTRCSELGYIALIGKMRFTIYDIYDNNSSGTDQVLLWDNDYRFDKRVKAMG